MAHGGGHSLQFPGANRGGWCTPSSHTLHPASYTLHLTPYTLQPTTYTLHPTPYTLHPTPYTLQPKSFTLHPTPYNPKPKPYTLHPALYTLSPTLGQSPYNRVWLPPALRIGPDLVYLIQSPSKSILEIKIDFDFYLLWELSRSRCRKPAITAPVRTRIGWSRLWIWSGREGWWS